MRIQATSPAPAVPRSWRTALLAAAFACAAALPCGAQTLYKWTDASGRVVYSDQPPTGNVKVEIVGAAPPPANPNAVKDMAAKDAQFAKRVAEKGEDAKKTEKARTDDEVKLNACRTLRLQLVQLGSSQYLLYKLNEKGEQVVMDDDERARQRAIAERLLREYQCPPA